MKLLFDFWIIYLEGYISTENLKAMFEFWVMYLESYFSTKNRKLMFEGPHEKESLHRRMAVKSENFP